MLYYFIFLGFGPLRYWRKTERTNAKHVRSFGSKAHEQEQNNKNMQKISKYVSLLFVVLWHCVAHVDAIRCFKAIYVDASTYSKRRPKETERCRNSWKRVSKRVRNMDMEKKTTSTKVVCPFSCIVYSHWEIKYAFACTLFALVNCNYFDSNSSSSA